MNFVLFLGAGFSKPFGLPVMNEFYDHALGESSPLDGTERNLVSELRQRIRNSASMLAADEDNLEHLLSVSLIADDAWPGAVNEQLLTSLWKVYRKLNPAHCQPLFDGALKRLVGFKEVDSHHHTVITTNYDVMAEFGFLRIGRPLGIPGEWQPSADERKRHELYDSKGSTRIICKLHGSVNWGLGPNCDTRGLLHVDGRVVTVSERNARERPTTWSLPNVSRVKMAAPSPPLIVPPTFYKGDYPKCFNPIWKAARDALRKAERVVFVGYSFPASDTHMKYFLACSLAESLRLRSIDILDLHADKICDRLRSESEGFGKTFKQRLRAFNGKWEEVDYNILEPLETQANLPVPKS